MDERVDVSMTEHLVKPIQPFLMNSRRGPLLFAGPNPRLWVFGKKKREPELETLSPEELVQRATALVDTAQDVLARLNRLLEVKGFGSEQR
jgi:hypothetical protein